MNYLFFLVILFGILTSNAQTYIPVLDIDHSWSVDFIEEPFGGGAQSTYTYQISLTDIQTHNGEDYYVVTNQFGDTGCLIRESNGVVYRYNINTMEESIMYDFTLEVGDVFTFDEMSTSEYCSIGSFNNYVLEATVDKVTTEFIANQDRKVIYFDDAEVEEIWIEGIGSINGFDPISATLDIFNETNLVCFNDNGTIWFFNNATSCENTMLDIDEFALTDSMVYPNPVDDTSILQVQPHLQATSVNIFNASGKLVMTKPLLNNATTISAMQLPSGLYFYTVQGNTSKFTTHKFIVK